MVLSCNVLISSAITVLICGAVVYFCHKRLLTIEQNVNKQNQVLAAFIANMQKDIQNGGNATCIRTNPGPGLGPVLYSHDLASEEAKSKVILLNNNNSSTISSYAPIDVSSDEDDDSSDDETSDDDTDDEIKTPTMEEEEEIKVDVNNLEECVLTDSWVKLIDVDISSIPATNQLPIERMIVLKQQEQEQEQEQHESDDDTMSRFLHESMFECLNGSSMNIGHGSGGAAFIVSSSSMPMPMNISAMFQAHLREPDPQNSVSSIMEIVDSDDSISSASSALAVENVVVDIVDIVDKANANANANVETKTINYSTMKVDDLRKIIVEQAVTTKENAKKLKKQEILDLLSLKK